METIRNLYSKVVACRLFSNFWFLFVIWTLMAMFPWLKALLHDSQDNTFLIFSHSFWHAINFQNLYQLYPEEYDDLYLYGPTFPLFVAPFAVVPYWLGHLLWQLAMVLPLFCAIKMSTFSRRRQVFLLWFCAVEMLNCVFQAQFNGVIAALILFSYICVENERDELSTLAILFGAFIKVYSIVGLAFFFFSKHKMRFVASFVVWAVLLFLLPMFMSSAEYVLSQYPAWADILAYKNTLNLVSWDQNISLLGFVRRVSGCQSYSDIWLIIPGLLLMAATYFRIPQWKNVAFRENVLASVMMFVTLFSTGTESYGHIISMVAVGIWYTSVPWHRGRVDLALIIFAFILTSMSPSDLFPAYLRQAYVIPYSLKALPVSLIWFKLCYEMLTHDYSTLSVATPCQQKR